MQRKLTRHHTATSTTCPCAATPYLKVDVVLVVELEQRIHVGRRHAGRLEQHRLEQVQVRLGHFLPFPDTLH
jgi:hypothetical protein